MGKQLSRSPRRTAKKGLLPLFNQTPAEQDLARTSRPKAVLPLMPRNARQAEALASIDQNILTFLIGPAGTGKTFLAAASAAMLLEKREIDTIIITRPAVEAGEELGFLPGEVEDKVAPWFAPFRIELEKRLGAGAVEAMLKGERIKFLPLAHMRGHTFERAFVVLDEAQNTTPCQMKLFLTRLGEDVRVVVDGDLAQGDLVDHRGKAVVNGLEDALSRIAGVVRDVGVVEFEEEDIVRSGFLRDLIVAYR